MTGKLAIGGLVAVAAMALTAGTASAQRVVQHGNHFHTISPAYGHSHYQPVYRPVYQPVYQPVYRPVYASPFPAYNSGFGFNQPVYGGYNSGFGFNNGFNNGYRGGYGGGRQSFGLSFNFIR